MDWLPYFSQQLIDGITRGSVYGMVAIGYTMVYGIIGMVNFAHGDVFMIGAFHAMIGFLILTAFGFSTTRYHQLLHRAVDRPAALAYDPMLVRRLRRLRSLRRKRRTAQRLGITL